MSYFVDRDGAEPLELLEREDVELPDEPITIHEPHLGDYVIPGWSAFDQVAATVALSLAFFGFLVLLWILR